MRVAFHTLGCKVNQYETEAMKEAFVSRGARIVLEDEVADVYIINSCTVTNIADRKSRQYIRRMKRVSPEAIVVVTGCYAQVASEEVSEIPEVDLVIGNSLKSTICERVYEFFANRNEEALCDGLAIEDTSVVDVLSREELNYYEDMGHIVSSESQLARAYIKIQEGCDRFCSYCMIPFARGPVRSRPLEEIVDEAVMVLEQGFKEIVLTGINTALYGTEDSFAFDRNPGEEGMTGLEAVISRLNNIEGDFRIRLSSVEPTVVDCEHVERLIRFEKLCHHLHLSVQSGSTHVLGFMNRHYTSDDYISIVKAIRDYDPLYGITTDIIVGFSGETEEDFEESLRVVRESEFVRVHPFRYSPRKGTVGASLNNAVSGKTKNERIEKLIGESSKVAADFERRNFEVPHKVLAEERFEGYTTGYTDNYIKAYIEDPKGVIPIGEFCNVRLVDLYEDGCLAVAEKGR
ncbi:MAG: tRNA (N(6)-L-threonylcarbamoyladenosine(37)-C(2))-methylthiotransferase MtaB [Clostridiales bacterium]|jgi:threonylcarbamoyladenosine tRNA methylthiotransferase MtaB|nr:tRNA (N(6)-L-threonylcarbamoyladenosine(37)-C(2))-methylthiotransferase MtaB [Clostridiales bacterium]